MFKKLLPLLLASTFSLSALADEAVIKKAVESKLGSKVTSISKAPYFGLYEVYVDGQILYTDDKVSALMIGNLIDGKTMKNLTEERMKSSTRLSSPICRLI